MTRSPAGILVIGYGNPGRLDDGLGPALAEAVEAMNLSGVTVDSDYQLTVEDAAAVAEHDAVIFADAAVDGDGPFYFRPIHAETDSSFTSHSVRPEAVLGLAQSLFTAETKGYALGIRGFEFNEFGQRLSDRAQENLAAAIDFIRSILLEGNLAEAAGRQAQRSAAGP